MEEFVCVPEKHRKEGLSRVFTGRERHCAHRFHCPELSDSPQTVLQRRTRYWVLVFGLLVLVRVRVMWSQNKYLDPRPSLYYITPKLQPLFLLDHSLLISPTNINTPAGPPSSTNYCTTSRHQCYL